MSRFECRGAHGRLLGSEFMGGVPTGGGDCSTRRGISPGCSVFNQAMIWMISSSLICPLNVGIMF